MTAFRASAEPSNAIRLRDALDDWNEHGLRRLSDTWFTEDILWRDLPELPDPVIVRGRDAVEVRVQEMVAAIGHWHFDLKRVEEHGDLTLSELELVGAGVKSHATFVGTVHQIQRWRDGRIAEVHSFSERAPALAAARELGGQRI
jgi:ketosteroid isomerase-like protein